jgi:alpha/beta superfamily hydrolase
MAPLRYDPASLSRARPAMSESPQPFPASQTELSLAGPAGTIEVLVDVPEPQHARAGTAIICHPHPLHGGSLHNKVVVMVERSLRELGLHTVRFNFRGVGASQGEYDEGRGETLDLLAVAEWAQAARPHDALWLAGFSFGSYVALLAARHLPVKQMISIAPPVGRWDFSAAIAPPCPWLVVQGEDDDVVDPQAVYAWIDAMPDKPSLVRMPETGHFFHRRLMDLRGAVKNGVRANLPPKLNP